MIEQHEIEEAREECLTALERLDIPTCMLCLSQVIATVAFNTSYAGDEEEIFSELCFDAHERLTELMALNMKQKQARHLRCLN